MSVVTRNVSEYVRKKGIKFIRTIPKHKDTVQGNL